MTMIKKIVVILECIIIMFFVISHYSIKKVNAITNMMRQKNVIIDVVLFDFEDKYISLVKQNLEDIQKQNPEKVRFNFYDSKGNQAIQNEILDNISRRSQDILLINLVDSKATEQVIERFRQTNIPIIFFNREPVPVESIKSYSNSYYVGTNAKEAGELQAEILINLWNNNKEIIDKNNNGILQYVILRGQQTNIEAQERSESVISTIEKAGIKTEQIHSVVANWNRDLARENISSLFLRFDTKVEVIIANNDEMAIGAIEALQKYGYNLGDPNKTITVVGIDAIPEAQELIKKGFMAGSVLQDPAEMAKTIYTLGTNVLQGKEPLSDIPYQFDETKIAIRLPYRKYMF
ncbi:galactose ABC transporter substrate-binding protein [Clostridium sp. C2-6-12]|uniref:galactose ABC transporter substrate-binding protein n=1 Tax=Clostridium sp. C2-6-12 TaxID=2698832 RepID=UPI00136F6ED1|nr:galactose ABC transporter substrate-binding protein [Clostridium sp. C2-6-12]